jgi:hypothetical protein
MKTQTIFTSISRSYRQALGSALTLAMLLLPRVGAAADSKSGWSTNLTPVLIFAKNQYRFGGGADPELKYTLDLGGARLSAGARVGGYYARNLFGLMVMPTIRLMVPVGPVEPYVAFGMGYGWLPAAGREGFATMSRLGLVFRFSERISIGVEGTVQKIDGSDFRFPSFGSMLSFDF